MKELFDQLRDPETTVARRRDLALFLKEFISLSQGLPPNGAQSKDNFFKVIFGCLLHNLPRLFTLDDRKRTRMKCWTWCIIKWLG